MQNSFPVLQSKQANLTIANKKFPWLNKHDDTFKNFISRFRKRLLFFYFDMSKHTFIFTDSHQTRLGDMLTQGKNIESAQPIAAATRTINTAEKQYPQIYFEALGIDFAMQIPTLYLRFSTTSDNVTDDKLLSPTFNGFKKGSFLTD